MQLENLIKVFNALKTLIKFNLYFQCNFLKPIKNNPFSYKIEDFDSKWIIFKIKSFAKK